MRSRFLVIHNSLAGLKRRRVLERTCDLLRSNGAGVRLEHADSLDADARLAAAAVDDGNFDAVVAAGGDSTVRGVAAGLAGTAMPLGIIPAGTGNVLAEEIGLARDPDATARCLLHGRAVEITGGSASGETFYEMAGAGFDARVLARLDIALKQRIGKLAYAGPILTELLRSQPRFEVEIDGHPMSCTWAIVSNVSRYAGGFMLVPGRSIQADGFHAVVVDARSRASMLGVLLALAAGRIDAHPGVTIVPCRRVRVRGAGAMAAQLDGEPISASILDVSPSPRPLRLIVPDSFAGCAE